MILIFFAIIAASNGDPSGIKGILGIIGIITVSILCLYALASAPQLIIALLIFIIIIAFIKSKLDD